MQGKETREDAVLFPISNPRRYRTKYKGDGVENIHKMKARFQRAVDYRMYQLENKSSQYDCTVPWTSAGYWNVWRHEGHVTNLTSSIPSWSIDFCTVSSLHGVLMNYATEQQRRFSTSSWGSWPFAHYIRSWFQNMRTGWEWFSYGRPSLLQPTFELWKNCCRRMKQTETLQIPTNKKNHVYETTKLNTVGKCRKDCGQDYLIWRRLQRARS